MRPKVRRRKRVVYVCEAVVKPTNLMSLSSILIFNLSILIRALQKVMDSALGPNRSRFHQQLTVSLKKKASKDRDRVRIISFPERLTLQYRTLTGLRRHRRGLTRSKHGKISTSSNLPSDVIDWHHSDRPGVWARMAGSRIFPPTRRVTGPSSSPSPSQAGWWSFPHTNILGFLIAVDVKFKQNI